jgi:hypothetical protein
MDPDGGQLRPFAERAPAGAAAARATASLGAMAATTRVSWCRCHSLVKTVHAVQSKRDQLVSLRGNCVGRMQ